MIVATRSQQPSFPVHAGILIGLGLGGFFDGIVLHQVLQWHHMLSSWYPINSVQNLELNTLWDGIFHSATYVFVIVGLFIFWRVGHNGHLAWSSKSFVGALLIGWGLFNFVEGLIDHQLLGVHHVNERVPREQWIYWDLAFLAWGLAMLAAGWRLMRAGHVEQAAPQAQ
ncbi:DUF2243 domain-containing protein [Methylobacterium dankookense]|uniref:DUF2243 domain-containing protein n=1 Tax=Methylobacterium dankookense TaxID=560405 RepID=A0A564FQI7_9HYPH|nr:DUF2243 domain-containing protein [Methylobacterium dankookense]GJD57965.1 hypothetical protein IFDJLNFL_3879 [Methylobacterium dankookense]VUF10423.1 hypothetical protein MTDSW087_00090 [Methylobacterium dankookense]